MRKDINSIDSRKKIILKAVVYDYIKTAEPIGSRHLIDTYKLGVKSATVRNELAELSELGLLYQPHTSAGRVPSDLGYRFYVDQLMEQSSVPSTQAVSVKTKLQELKTEMDIIISQTCRILSELSKYASVATHPNISEAVINHISISTLSPNKHLLVVVLDNGRVLHGILDINFSKLNLDNTKAANFLMSALCGKGLEDLDSAVENIDESSSYLELLKDVILYLKKESDVIKDFDIHTQGTSYIINQPEFKKDVQRLEKVLSVLEERAQIYKMLSSAYLDDDVTVIIGSENPISQMSDCSFVATRYKVKGRSAGTIGVVGPKRMDYSRAVASVEFMAGTLSMLLDDLI
ncbi:MAG: heat-inducible transcriptional repressor HrcA [Armatimonadota bacterium]